MSEPSEIDEWVEVSFGDLLLHRRERGRNTDALLSVTSDRGIVPHASAGRRDISSTDKSGYWRVYPGDIAYNSMRMWQGVSGRSDYAGIVSPAYTVCAPSPLVDSRFAAHLLKHPLNVAAFRNRSQGLVSDTWNLKYRAFAPILTTVPTIRHQRRIAAILDTVDEAIRSTERLVAKLGLVKQGLLHDLLARGIDDNGDLRDLGTAFAETPIGRVPIDWRVTTVSDEFTIQSGLTLGPHRVPRRNPTPYLRVANVRRSRIDSSSIAHLEATRADKARYGLQVGDLLVVEGHADPDQIGRCALVTASVAGMLYQNHLFRLRPVKMTSEYASLWLNSPMARSYWHRTCSSSSGLQTINSKQLRLLPVLVPPEREQAAMVKAVEAVDSDLEAHGSALSKLRVLKAGLMDDLLTGRVRVNTAGAAAAS